MENSLKIDSLIKFFIKENNLENGLETVNEKIKIGEIIQKRVINVVLFKLKFKF